MNFPDFYEQAPVIPTHDPFAAMLGAARDGRFDYHYLDAVRLAGHSCPTVAGAFLIGRAALAALYRRVLLNAAILPCTCLHQKMRGLRASWRKS